VPTADYYALIFRVVRETQNPGPVERQAIYDRARAALRALPDATIVSERRWLEAAIDQIEADWSVSERRIIPSDVRPLDRLVAELGKLKIKSPWSS
jgi:hypothetical protein